MYVVTSVFVLILMDVGLHDIDICGCCLYLYHPQCNVVLWYIHVRGNVIVWYQY